jgi:uncharacterized integral membrane protein (TIGR00698 family)
MVLGAIILCVAWFGITASSSDALTNKPTLENSLKGKVAKLETWTSNPVDAFYAKPKEKDKPASFIGGSILATFLALILVIVPLGWSQGKSLVPFSLAFGALFLLAILAFVLSSQAVVKQYNFEYVLWALLLGLVISNTLGVPKVLEPILIGETFVKLGIVLLGAEVLMSKLLALGVPGICTSWIVTPIVLISTFWFGQRVLKIKSPSLNMVISADMSVCGVSAAIATGAACRAKKEEISYAIGVSLFFTAIMMIVQPYIIRWSGLDPIVGAAWIGGTIDSTGAVVAAGAVLGKEAETVATTVKMIQNVLIGVVAFAVALYWSSRYPETSDRDETQSTSLDSRSIQPAYTKPSLFEIWKRFPKFILGFIAASLVFSSFPMMFEHGGPISEAITKETTSPLRTWLFCLAFVAIGLQTDFRKLWPYLSGSRPMLLYVLGQCLNLLLSFLMAYLMFGILFANQFSGGGK